MTEKNQSQVAEIDNLYLYYRDINHSERLSENFYRQSKNKSVHNNVRERCRASDIEGIYKNLTRKLLLIKAFLEGNLIICRLNTG